MFFLGAVRCSDNKRARTCDYSFTVRLRKWPGSDCFKGKFQNFVTTKTLKNISLQSKNVSRARSMPE